MRNIVSRFGGIDEEERNEFDLWAFGEDASYFTLEKCLDLWNERHGDKYLLRSDGKLADDIPKMIQIWRSQLLSPKDESL